MVFNINGLSMHVLDAGFDEPDRPLVLLLHGFPDLCYCWRKIMVHLAAAGYRVVAPINGGTAAPAAGMMPMMLILERSACTGPPALPFNSANRSQAEEAAEDSANNMRAQLAALHPPRKFYQHYYALREAQR